MKDISELEISQAGRTRSKSLILEGCVTPEDRQTALYTIKEEDFEYQGKLYVSLYKKYMELEDIHEVDFARAYFKSYKNFKSLCNSPWFKPYIEAWREELELVLMSRGFNKLKNTLTSDDRSSVVVAKYFLDRTWDQGIHSNPQGKRGRGRPTKKTLQDQVVSGDVMDDYKRLIKN